MQTVQSKSKSSSSTTATATATTTTTPIKSLLSSRRRDLRKSKNKSYSLSNSSIVSSSSSSSSVLSSSPKALNVTSSTMNTTISPQMKMPSIHCSNTSTFTRSLYSPSPVTPVVPLSPKPSPTPPSSSKITNAPRIIKSYASSSNTNSSSSGYIGSKRHRRNISLSSQSSYISALSSSHSITPVSSPEMSFLKSAAAARKKNVSSTAQTSSPVSPPSLCTASSFSSSSPSSSAQQNNDSNVKSLLLKYSIPSTSMLKSSTHAGNDQRHHHHHHKIENKKLTETGTVASTAISNNTKTATTTGAKNTARIPNNNNNDVGRFSRSNLRRRFEKGNNSGSISSSGSNNATTKSVEDNVRISPINHMKKVVSKDDIQLSKKNDKSNEALKTMTSSKTTSKDDNNEQQDVPHSAFNAIYQRRHHWNEKNNNNSENGEKGVVRSNVKMKPIQLNNEQNKSKISNAIVSNKNIETTTTTTNTDTDTNHEFTYSNLHSMWSQRDKKQKNFNIKISPPTATTPIQLKISKSPIRQRLSVMQNAYGSRTAASRQFLHRSSAGGRGSVGKIYKEKCGKDLHSNVDNAHKHGKDSNNSVVAVEQNNNTKEGNDYLPNEGTFNTKRSSESSSSELRKNDIGNEDTKKNDIGVHVQSGDKDDVDSVVKVKNAIQSIANTFESASTSSTFSTSFLKSKLPHDLLNVSSPSHPQPKASSFNRMKIQEQQSNVNINDELEDKESNYNDDIDERATINDSSYNEETTSLLLKTNSNTLAFEDKLDEYRKDDGKCSKYVCNVGNTGSVSQGQNYEYYDSKEEQDNDDDSDKVNSILSEILPRRLEDLSLSQSEKEDYNSEARNELSEANTKEEGLPVERSSIDNAVSEKDNDDQCSSSRERLKDLFSNVDTTPNSVFDPFNELLISEDDSVVKQQWEEVSFESLPSIDSKTAEKYGISTDTTHISPSMTDTTSSTPWSSSLLESAHVSSSLSHNSISSETSPQNVFEPFSSLDTMMSSCNKQDTNNFDSSIVSWQEHSFESMSNHDHIELQVPEKQLTFQSLANYSNKINFEQMDNNSNELIGQAARVDEENNYRNNFVDNNSVRAADPYDFYDSMSTANSEITVKIENKLKYARARIGDYSPKSCQIPNYKQEVMGFHNIQTFDFNDDKESTIPDSAFGISQSEKRSDALLTSSLNLISLARKQKEIMSGSTEEVVYGSDSKDVEENDHEDEGDNGEDTCSDTPVFTFPSYLTYNPNGPKALSDSGTDVFDGLSSVAGPSLAKSSALSMDLFTKSMSTSKKVQHNKLINRAISRENMTRTLITPTEEVIPTTVDEREVSTKDEVLKTSDGNERLQTTSDDGTLPSDYENTNRKVQKKRFGKYLSNLALRAKASNLKRVWRNGRSIDKEVNVDDDQSHDRNIVGISRPPTPGKSKVKPKTTWTRDEIIEDINHSDTSCQNSTNKQAAAGGEITKNQGEPSIIAYECPPIEDIKANVGWIPSMIRLYGNKIPTETISSPSSAFDTFKKDSSFAEVTMDECKLEGTQFLQLNSGGSFSLQKCNEDLYKPIRKKLRQFLEGRNDWHGVRKSRPGMFEKALQTHERVLALLVNNRYDHALELYEKFFENYGNRDFAIDDKVLEKRIVATLLFNMAILNICEQDFKTGADFFNEAIKSLSYSNYSDKEMCIFYIELGITHYALGEFDVALQIFEDSLTKMKTYNDHHLIVKLLNNIGSTHFAKQNVSASLNAFFEVLEVQRTYFIQRFGSQLHLNEEELEGLKDILQSMSFTLQNLAYVHAFIDDESATSFFTDSASSINQTLIARAKGLEVKILPSVPSGSFEL